MDRILALCKSDPLSVDELIADCLDLAVSGSSNERELSFSVLIALLALDQQHACYLRKLGEHKSARVRSELAYHACRIVDTDLRTSLLNRLLQDRASTVRRRAARTVGLAGAQPCLATLRQSLTNETNAKTKEEMEYWVPLLEVGHRVDPSVHEGAYTATVKSDRGIVSTTVFTDSPDSDAIRHEVTKLKECEYG